MVVSGRIPSVKISLLAMLFISGLLFPAFPTLDTTITITVSKPAAPDGPDSLVSAGMHFPPGVLMDSTKLRVLDGAAEVRRGVEVLSRWVNDHSIHSVLLQFKTDLGPITTKTFSVVTGQAPQVANLTIVPVTWKYPKGIFITDKAWLCRSGVVWEQIPTGNASYVSYDGRAMGGFTTDNGTVMSNCVESSPPEGYYDTPHNLYQLYARSGVANILLGARNWAVHHRDDQIQASGTNIGHSYCTDLGKTRYTYVEALVEDYYFFGDKRSLQRARLVADTFYSRMGNGTFYQGPAATGFWTEREPAFAFLGIVTAYEATGDSRYLTKASALMTTLHKMQADNGGNVAWKHDIYEHDPSEGCSPGDRGSSSFMTGLLLEGIVKYHKLTNDPVARESILWAVDWLLANARSSHGDWFVYLSCPAVAALTDPYYDLNLLMVHALGYAYALTGAANYRDVAKRLFDAGVTNAYLGDAKHYNQNYRTSGHYLGYVNGQKIINWTASGTETAGAAGFIRLENYPNPFSAEMRLRFTLANAGPVRLEIYDISGKLIRLVLNQMLPAGGQAWNVDGRSLAPGVYFACLRTPLSVVTRKMAVVRP